MRMYVMWIRMSDNAAVCCSIWRLYIRRLNICTDLFSNVQQATWDCLFLISALSSWVDHKSRRQDTSRRDSFSAFSEDNNPPLYLPSINVCHVSFKSWLRGHHIFFISKSRQIIVLPVPWPQWSQPSSRIEHPHKEMSMPHAINQHSVSHFHQDRERERGRQKRVVIILILICIDLHFERPWCEATCLSSTRERPKTEATHSHSLWLASDDVKKLGQESRINNKWPIFWLKNPQPAWLNHERSWKHAATTGFVLKKLFNILQLWTLWSCSLVQFAFIWNIRSFLRSSTTPPESMLFTRRIFSSIDAISSQLFQPRPALTLKQIETWSLYPSWCLFNISITWGHIGA